MYHLGLLQRLRGLPLGYDYFLTYGQRRRDEMYRGMETAYMMGQSEIARMRQKIAVEYLAAQLGLSGFAEGTSRHQFITARTERIGALHQQLQALVGDHAIALVAETMEAVPENATRQDILQVLLYELGDSEATQHLLDYVQDMWATIDLLTQRVGPEATRRIIDAPVCLPTREVICS